MLHPQLPMELTEENKAKIDSMNYEELLRRWRFTPIGDPWFEGDTGQYWSDRMREIRSQPEGNAIHVSASKRVGHVTD